MLTVKIKSQINHGLIASRNMPDESNFKQWESMAYRLMVTTERSFPDMYCIVTDDETKKIHTIFKVN